ncbi:hypothetical protein EJ04DRAFT_480748 [Polyplosphaeria fusca]|uniref:RING-type domain-containing protein n=1 Tax=Polyplosphaeria fusca TaxID=682080 RepID=A0A9P4R982_9PLEO|nr:hypothetical protein EJ04DRAFT_480748 [Polyplosphaeria fusca]
MKHPGNAPPTRRHDICPHTMTSLRSNRRISENDRQCSICQNTYFSILDGEPVLPVRLACDHIFCRSCVETNFNYDIKCPWPFCRDLPEIKPEFCDLCAFWLRENHQDSLLVTVRAEMLQSIKTAYRHLHHGHEYFKLDAEDKKKLFDHIRETLTTYEWQFHAGVDLGELLDPFLLAIDHRAAVDHFGPDLSKPAPEPNYFGPRANDDYSAAEEPWLAGFLRQWAVEYVRENGEIRQGEWGIWDKKRDQAEDDNVWLWPYKGIVGHKTEPDGSIRYLVKWVGQRFPDSWEMRKQLDEEVCRRYNRKHGLRAAGDQGKSRKKKQPAKKRKTVAAAAAPSARKRKTRSG